DEASYIDRGERCHDCHPSWPVTSRPDPVDRTLRDIAGAWQPRRFNQRGGGAYQGTRASRDLGWGFLPALRWRHRRSDRAGQQSDPGDLRPSTTEGDWRWWLSRTWSDTGLCPG